jgi:hypothetical protein
MTDMSIATLTVDNSGARASLAELRQDFVQVGAALESNTRRLANYGREFNTVARQLGVYTDGVERHARVVQAADRALKAADITREQHARIVAESAARYDRDTRAAQDNARAAEQQAQAQAALAASVEEVRRRYDQTYRELQAYAAETNRVTKILEQANVAEEERARLLRAVAQAHDPAIRAARDQAAAFEALEARLDQAGAATRRLAADQALLDRRRDAGDLTPERHAALTRALNDQAQAHTNAARGASAQANAARILVPQLNDVFVQASMGTPVLQILTQQGPQIADGFLMAGKEALLAAARFALIAAPVLAIGAAIGVYEARASSIRGVERAFALMGTGAAAAGGQVEALSAAAAAAGNVSVSAARDMVAEYTRVGQVAPAVMARVVAITRDYATLTGQDATKATSELARLLRDPAKGAAELADGINLLSGAMLDHIRRLSESGRHTEAQRVLVEALAQRVKGAAEETSIWARAWNAVATYASNAADAMGKAIDRSLNGPTLDERIEKAREALVAFRREAEENAALGDPDKSWQPGQSVGEGPAPARQPSVAVQQAEAGLERLRELARERNRVGAVQQRDANNNAAGRAAVETARRYDELGEAIRSTEADIERLNRGMGANMGAAAAAGGKAAEGLRNRLEGLNAARAAGVDMATHKADQLAKAEQKAAGMGEQARAKYLAGERTRIELLDAALTKKEKEARVKAAQASVTAQQAQASADAVQGLNAQTHAQDLLADAAGKGEAAQRRARLEAEVHTAALKGLGDATRAALEAQEAATVRQIRGDQTAVITKEIKAQDELTAAIAKGPAAAAEAERATQAHALALREAQEGTDAFSATYQHYLTLLRDKATSEAGTEVARLGDTLAKARRQLDFRAATAGLGDEQKAVAKAQAEILDSFRAYRDAQGQLAPKLQTQLDTLLKQAEANARLEISVQRQEAAWTQLGQVGERAFDRLGDALTQVFASGERKAINLGSLLRGVLASVATDLVKLGAVAPLKNLIFGTSSATLWDAFSSPSAVAGAAAGQTSAGGIGAGNLLSLGSKFIPSSWTSGITTALDNWAALNLGIGGVASSSVASAAAASQLAAAGVQGATVYSAVPGIANSAVIATPLGTNSAAVGSALTTANAPVAGSAAAGASLSGILGAAGIGAAVGGLLGPALFPNNRVASGLVGAGSGAAAGALAGTFLFPGVGTALGAILGGAGGGLLGVFGAGAKPSNMEGVSHLNLATGKEVIDGQTGARFSQANRDEASKIAKGVHDMYKALAEYAGGRTIAKDIAVGVGSRDGIRVQYNGPGNEARFSRDEQGIKDLTSWFLKRFAEELKDGFDPVLKKAIDQIDWSDTEKAFKQLDVASNFTDTIAAMSGGYGIEDATKKAAREQARKDRKAVDEWLETVGELFPSTTTGGTTRTETTREPVSMSAADAISKGLLTREQEYQGDATWTTVYKDLEGRIVQVGESLTDTVTVWQEATKTITAGGTTVASAEATQARAAVKAYVDSIVNAVDPKTYSQVEAAVASANARISELKPLLEAAGYTAAEIPAKIAEATTNTMGRNRREYSAGLRDRYDALFGRDQSQTRGAAAQYATDIRDSKAVHAEGAARDGAQDRAASILDVQAKAAAGIKTVSSAFSTTAADVIGDLGLTGSALSTVTDRLTTFRDAAKQGGVSAAEFSATLATFAAMVKAGTLTDTQFSSIVGQITSWMGESRSVDTTDRQGRASVAATINPAYRASVGSILADLGVADTTGQTLAGLTQTVTDFEAAAKAGGVSLQAMTDTTAWLGTLYRQGQIDAEQYGSLIAYINDRFGASRAVQDAQRGATIAVESARNPAYRAGVDAQLASLGLSATAISALRPNWSVAETAATGGTLTDSHVDAVLRDLNTELTAGVVTVEQYGTAVGLLTQQLQRSQQIADRVVDLQDVRSQLQARAGLITQAQADDAARATRQARELRDAGSEAERAQLRLNQALENQLVAADRLAARYDALTNLQGRTAALQGNDLAATLAGVDQQAEQQRREYRARGASAAEMANLNAVLAAERNQAIFQATQRDLLDAYDREIRARTDANDQLERTVLETGRIAKSFKAAADSLRISDASPLSQLEKLVDVRRQWDAKLAAYNAATTSEERATLAQELQALGSQRVELAQGYYASTDRSDYDAVMAVFNQFGAYQESAVTAAERTIAQNNAQIEELRRARDLASRLGERTIGSIDSLNSATQAALATLNTSIGALAPLTAQSAQSSFLTNMTAANANDYVAWGRAQGPETLAAVYRQANQLGAYYGRFSYATPAGLGGTDQRWDDAATQAALTFLRGLGYSGQWDANANIFLQAYGQGDAYTAWLRDYARTRWGIGGGGNLAYERGGVVGAYATGGVVGNGVWGRDSVLATYAGGGFIALAGREGVLTASATEAIGGAATIEHINRTGRLPVANDALPSGVIGFRPRREEAAGSGGVENRLDRVLQVLERLVGAVEAGAGMTVAETRGVADELRTVGRQLRTDPSPVGRRVAGGRG